MILLRQISALLLGSLAITHADDASIPARELVDRQFALASAEMQTEKMLRWARERKMPEVIFLMGALMRLQSTPALARLQFSQIVLARGDLHEWPSLWGDQVGAVQLYESWGVRGFILSGLRDSGEMDNRLMEVDIADAQWRNYLRWLVEKRLGELGHPVSSPMPQPPDPSWASLPPGTGKVDGPATPPKTQPPPTPPAPVSPISHVDPGATTQARTAFNPGWWLGGGALALAAAAWQIWRKRRRTP